MSFDKDFEKFIREFLKRILHDSNIWRMFEEAGIPKPSEKDIDDAVKFISNIKFYGFSITMGPDGKPVIHEIKPEQFFMGINNFLKTPTSNPIEEEKGEEILSYEELIDVFETEEGVQIVMETEDPDKVSIDVVDDGKRIIVKIAGKRYEYESPVRIKDKPIRRRYKNGILEVIYPRRSK